MFDAVIVGAGCAGAVVARELAEKQNKKVLIIDKRNHIGGNCYDTEDEYQVLIHQYGPHIFHTNSKEVYEYLSRFTSWYDYQHEVVGNVYGKMIPVPFNLNTLEMVFDQEKAEKCKKILLETFGENARVPILELMKHDEKELRDIADYVYENIFLKYTMKQWGKSPKEIDPAVSGRVPVILSYDNRYFQDQYQGMPLDGYTGMFEKMLNHENITCRLNTEAKDVINLDGNGNIIIDGSIFHGHVIYTGAIDEFFDCRFGRLPYRSLSFQFEHYAQDKYQDHGVVNYTVSEDYTRITEFKKLTGQKCKGTTIMKEYPIPYEGKEGEIPYYSISNEENQALYEKYLGLLKDVPNFHLLGRLAEYKYYNIDGIVEKALHFVQTIQ